MIDDQSYTLNTNQLKNLRLFYKFRFISIPLLTKYKRTNTNTALIKSLRLLVDKGYLERLYEPHYRIQTKPAVYWLSHRGMKVVSAMEGIDPKILHGFYKNKTLGREARQHQLDIMEAYIHLRDSYGEKLKIQTMQDLTDADLETLPKQKPDLVINGEVNYALCLVHDTPAYMARKRLTNYIDHLEDNGYWKETREGVEEFTNEYDQYPTLLFVLKDEVNETRFIDYAYKVCENIGFEEGELPIATTTWELLANNPADTAAWIYLESRKERQSLKVSYN